MGAVVLQGEASRLPLADEVADAVIVSPPYWNQRDYKSGGKSLKGQLGAEATPWEYLDNLVECMREWARVLKPSGSIFVNLGDVYSNRADGAAGRTWREDRADAMLPRRNGTRHIRRTSLMGLPWRFALACMDQTAVGYRNQVAAGLLDGVLGGTVTHGEARRRLAEFDASPKSEGLGLILRAEIIWHKKNGMPESVKNRVTRAHEQLFHFTKSETFYSATDLIREPHEMRPQRRPNGHKQRQRLGVLPAQTFSTSARDELGVDGHPLGKMPRSVWRTRVASLSVPEHVEHARCCAQALAATGHARPDCEDGVDHHASWPAELVEYMILGWSPPGICTACGEGRFPVVDRPGLRGGDNNPHSRDGTRMKPTMDGGQREWDQRMACPDKLLGFACPCCPYTDHPGSEERSSRRGYAAVPGNRPQGKYGRHQAGEYKRVGPWREWHFDRWEAAPTRPAVIVDPCGGAGTTGLVGDVLRRHVVSSDLSGDYGRIARWRITDPGERAMALHKPRPEPVPEAQAALFDMGEAVS